MLYSYGWHEIFIGCCHSSLLGLVDILEHFLHSLDRELYYPVSKTQLETGSDTFWSSGCSIELD